MKKLLLISNRVMHYRVSIYNYFYDHLMKNGWKLFVRANELQKQNQHKIKFDFKEIPFKFLQYRNEIKNINPDAIIIFLHLKDKIIWPLVHWVKFKNYPVAFWTKGMNLDRPDSTSSRLLYKYMHGIFDHLILYSEREMQHVNPKHHKKVSIAPNTINFWDFPKISESKQEIKNEFSIPYEKVVLAVGRMGADKGRKKVEHLIKIFNDLKDPKYGLVIVGSGLNRDLIKKNGNILYLGEIHDPENIKISKIFKMADVFSLPGHIGLGINQAFFWNLPVVTEEGRQPPEITYLKNNQNGFIVPENDIKQLKEKIIYLLENDSIRIKFSEYGKQTIMEKASVENMIEGFYNFIKKF